jgi:hypothetical protein
MNPKKYLENRLRGWLPEEPNLHSIKRAMGRHNLVKKPVVGLVLLSLGVTLFLFSFLIATKTDTAIDTSFVLEPTEKYGPYENGTYYHTHVISKSTLMGEVIVEGGGVYFTANGYNTQHLKNIFINQNYSLVIEPADDQYTFTFENTGGNLQSSIKFTLKERWMPFLSLTPAFIILLISAPIGTVLIIAGLRKKPSKKEEIC